MSAVDRFKPCPKGCADPMERVAVNSADSPTELTYIYLCGNCGRREPAYKEVLRQEGRSSGLDA
jgi:hypothetical protein